MKWSELGKRLVNFIWDKTAKTHHLILMRFQFCSVVFFKKKFDSNSDSEAHGGEVDDVCKLSDQKTFIGITNNKQDISINYAN